MVTNKTLPKLNVREFRSFGLLDLEANPEGNVIEGHPAVYDQKVSVGSWFYEVIERGAFNECNFDDVLFTSNHGLDRIPLARSRRNNANSTLQITLDDKGVKIKASLDCENNVEAKSLYSAVGRADIDGMSFIFCIGEDRWIDLDTDMPTRFITKIAKVIETSAVNFPTYSGTDIDARDQSALDNAKRALDNARSEVDTLKRSADMLELERYKTQILMK